MYACMYCMIFNVPDVLTARVCMCICMQARKYLLQLRKVLQNRETAKVAEILSLIEGSSFFAQRPNSTVATMFNKDVKVCM